MDTAKKIKIKCRRCGYEWYAIYDPRKAYYQCPKCKYPNKTDHTERGLSLSSPSQNEEVKI